MDARRRQISVAIQDCRYSLIKATDDGAGIYVDDRSIETWLQLLIGTMKRAVSEIS
jgi:hypothetical protein